jgi:hypothetical protein
MCHEQTYKNKEKIFLLNQTKQKRKSKLNIETSEEKTPFSFVFLNSARKYFSFYFYFSIDKVVNTIETLSHIS